MAIIHDKFIFIRNPKTASDSIKNFLNTSLNTKEIHGKNRGGHVGAEEIINRIDSKYKLLFGVVRNPFDWYVSWWSFLKIKGRNKIVFKECKLDDFNCFISFLNEDKRQIIKDGSKRREWQLDNNIGYATYFFIRTFCKHETFKNNIESFNYDTDFLLDRLLRYENINKELYYLMKDINVNINYDKNSLTRYNNNKTSHKHYNFYYNNKNIDSIYKMDRILIERFGYEFK